MLYHRYYRHHRQIQIWLYIVVVLEPCGVSLSISELEDLSQSKLWKDKSEWSNEVQEIRRELVHGKRMSHSEICLRLKTLKLVDKKVHINE